jgi:uncharacterized iron-regulated membrane protein
MRSGLVRALTVSVALSFTSGCMFTQWTDHAFFGVPEDPPEHVDRQWVGAVVLPLAVVGDIVTFPGQIIALMVTGDWSIYRGDEGRISMAPSEMRVAAVDAEGRRTEVALSHDQKLAIAAVIEAGAYDSETRTATN